jgi:hypothetical protein
MNFSSSLYYSDDCFHPHLGRVRFCHLLLLPSLAQAWSDFWRDNRAPARYASNETALLMGLDSTARRT